MAILTLSYSAKPDSAPSQSGWNSFALDFEGTYVFTVADFTTDTNPEYIGNTFFSTKIVSLPSKGTLVLSGVNISENDEITAVDIQSGNFSYVALSSEPGYTDSFCEFLVSDEDSLLYNSLPNELIFVVAGSSNKPPSSVGSFSISLPNPGSYTFNSADFTTQTTPAYADPENDPPYAIRITSLPTYGTFMYNGNPMSNGAVIPVADLDNGLLVLKANSDQNTTITQEIVYFSVSDSGSFNFTSGGEMTIGLSLFQRSSPTINQESDVYITEGNDYIFNRYDLVTAAGYNDLDGDSAQSIRFTVLPTHGSIKLNGFSISVNQEISLSDIDNNLLTYNISGGAIGDYEMNYQVKDSSGAWSN